MQLLNVGVQVFDAAIPIEQLSASSPAQLQKLQSHYSGKLFFKVETVKETDLLLTLSLWRFFLIVHVTLVKL